MAYMNSRPAHCMPPRRHRGFTLTELLVTMVVIAIIAAISMPVYQDYSRGARRAAAVSMLTDLASRQEQYFLDNRSYAGTLTALGFPTATLQTDGGYYTVSVSAFTASSYTLRAVPTAQQATADCGDLTLDNNQTKTPAACFTK